MTSTTDRPLPDRPASELRVVAGLHVHDWPGDGPVVVGLPGLGSAGVVWSELARALPGHRVVAPDLRGRGRSSEATGEPGLRNHARDVARIASDLDLRDAVVVGHSMGAYLSPLVAQELGDRVQRLVLVDGGVPPGLPFFMTRGLVAAAFRKEMRKADKDWLDGEAFAQEFFAKELTARPELLPVVAGWAEYELTGEPGARRPRLAADHAVADAVDTLRGRDVVPALEALRVPAHVVAAAHKKGTSGRPFLPDRALRRYERQVARLTWERVPGTNHVTVLFSDEVVRAVRGAA